MVKYSSPWSRRKFLTAVGSVGATAILSPQILWAVTDEPDPRTAAIVANTIGVDTHNHVDVPLVAAEVPGPDIDLAGELKRSGLSAICMTFAVDYQRLDQEGQAYERFKNGLASMDQQLAKNNITRTVNLAGLRSAHRKHLPAVIQSIEGCHFLEGHIERVDEAYHRGVRHLGLLHDSDASTPLGDVYTNPATFGGLTKFGAEVIKRCDKLGILIDLAHASTETVAAALKITKQPVIISHTGLDTQLGKNPNMARMMRPRLISKEQAKTVASAGGIIGVWTHLADTPLEYAQNIRALVDVVGIDYVCIGTDTKLTPSYRSPSGGNNFRPDNNANKAGQNADNKQAARPEGERPRNRVGERTNEAWQDQKTGFYYVVVDAMLKTGFTPDEIGKIGGGNFCRVFDAATKNH